MKIHFLILFSLTTFSSIAQQEGEIVNNSFKTSQIFGFQPSNTDKTNGLHFDFRMENIEYTHLDTVNHVFVNGLNFKVGLLSMFQLLWLESEHWKMYDADSLENLDIALQRTNMWINGININGIATLGSTKINGLSISGATTTVSQINGISIAGLTNFSYALNGISIASLRNHSTKVNGIQVGIYNQTQKLNGVQVGLLNKSTNTKGLQIGLINKNEKKTMILINW